MPYTDVTVNNLVVNVLTQDEYDSIQDPSNSELYLITDDAITPAQAVEDVATVSAVGTSTQYARADHVHAITGTAITSALGYTPGQGTLTDSQVNGTSIVSNGVANLVTNTAYNASTNKLATMSDVPEDKLFLVTATMSGLTAGTSDKSVTEIAAAVAAGKFVYIKTTVGTTTITAPLMHVVDTVDVSKAVFNYDDQQNSSQLYHAVLEITGTTVTVTWTNEKYARESQIPDSTSDLTNDSGFITAATAPVSSVNTKTGAVVLTAADVGALPDTTIIPTKTSDLTNDSGYITSYTETDPTVPEWAKQSTKPVYTASEVGALPDTYTAPVTSVNGQTGAVSLTIPSAVTNSYSVDSNSGKVMLYTSTNSSSTVTQTKTSGALDFSIRSGGDATLQIGKSSTDEGTRGLIKISNHANANYTTIDAPAWAATEIHLPSSSGTLALTSEIPSVSVTDVQINGTSIISNDVANIVTNTAYNASSNKIATMSDVPDESKIRKYDLIVEFELDDSTGEITSSHTMSQIEAVSDAGGSVCGHMIHTETSDGVTYTTDKGYFDYYGSEFKQFAYDGWNYNYIYYDEDNSEWISDYSSYYIDGNFRVNASLLSNGNYSLSIPGNSSPTFDDIAQYVSNSGYAIYLNVTDLSHFASGTYPSFYLPMTYRFVSSSHPTNEMIIFSGTIFDGTDVVIRTIKLTRGSNGEYIVTVINTPTVLPIYNGEVS